MDAVILWLQQNVTTQLAVVLIRTGSKQQSQLHNNREGGEMGNPSFIKQAYGVCVCVCVMLLVCRTFVMEKLSN